MNIATIVESLQTELNTNIIAPLRPNTKMEYRVILDSSEYKSCSLEENETTYYINTVMTISDTKVEGTSQGNYESTITARLEYLIPVDIGISGDAGYTLIDEIRRHIDDTFKYSKLYNLIGGETVLVECAPSITGTREIRDYVGDSMTLISDLEMVVISGGILSDSIEYFYGSERIYPRRASVSRKSITTGNITNDSNGASLNTVEGHSLVITGDFIARHGAFTNAMKDYLLNGSIAALSIKVRFPTATGTYTEMTKNMIFDSCVLCTESSTFAAFSITLIEKWR